MWAGDSVTIAETAEVTASGTAVWRGKPHEVRPLAVQTERSTESLTNGKEVSLESIFVRVKNSLGTRREAGQSQGRCAVSSSSIAPSCAGNAAFESEDWVRTLENQQEALPEFEIRGGSYGGLGGVAADRCESDAFSRHLFLFNTSSAMQGSIPDTRMLLPGSPASV